jgi:hypothetical protein
MSNAIFDVTQEGSALLGAWAKYRNIPITGVVADVNHKASMEDFRNFKGFDPKNASPEFNELFLAQWHLEATTRQQAIHAVNVIQSIPVKQRHRAFVYQPTIEMLTDIQKDHDRTASLQHIANEAGVSIDVPRTQRSLTDKQLLALMMFSLLAGGLTIISYRKVWNRRNGGMELTLGSVVSEPSWKKELAADSIAFTTRAIMFWGAGKIMDRLGFNSLPVRIATSSVAKSVMYAIVKGKTPNIPIIVVQAMFSTVLGSILKDKPTVMNYMIEVVVPKIHI